MELNEAATHLFSIFFRMVSLGVVGSSDCFSFPVFTNGWMLSPLTLTKTVHVATGIVKAQTSNKSVLQHSTSKRVTCCEIF